MGLESIRDNMMLAIGSIRPEALSRPWADKTREFEEKEGPWADYAAWQWWFAEREAKETTMNAAPIRDSLEYDQDIVLYGMMCDLADGKFAPGKS